MIALTLWQLRWRILLLVAVAAVFYLLEPEFHLHGVDTKDLDPLIADPRGVAFTLANLAGVSMLVLLTGFVSGDRRRGYYRIYFSHPTRPLAYYGLRWLVAYAVSLAFALLFLEIGQLAAWGELRVGLEVMIHPALFALVYGGLAAFFSVAFPRGDTLAALAVFVVTSVWEYTLEVFDQLSTHPVAPALQQLISFVLPPHFALRDAFEVMRAGHTAWGDFAFAGGYGVFWLVAAALLLWRREWP
jgi:hypothetical protein